MLLFHTSSLTMSSALLFTEEANVFQNYLKALKSVFNNDWQSRGSLFSLRIEIFPANPFFLFDCLIIKVRVALMTGLYYVGSQPLETS